MCFLLHELKPQAKNAWNLRREEKGKILFATLIEVTLVNLGRLIRLYDTNIWEWVER